MAAPRANTQAEYNRVKAQIDKIDGQLDIVVEEYNSSNDALKKTQGEIAEHTARLRAAEQALAKRQGMINKRFSSIYRQGGLSYVEVLMSTKSLEQFMYLLELIQRQGEFDAKTIAAIKEDQRRIQEENAALFEKEKQQKDLVAQLKGKRDKIAADLETRNDLLKKIRKELRAQRQAELREQAKLRKKLRVSMRYSGIKVSRGGGRSSAVSIAMSELGKPYSWGASGPSSFDCSGLTRYVYGQLGVSLPHSSRAQYGSGRHVSRDELAAGDLVFFARGGTISHVGIYVGGGSFIHAPRTGDVVKISSLGGHGGYVGAVRP